MIIIGGVYSEYCYYPKSHQVFGSGGRAGAVMAKLGVNGFRLIACAPASEAKAIGAALAPYDFDYELVASDVLYEFAYTHPLSDPYLTPFPVTKIPFPNTIKNDCILAFGMLEGMPNVEARRIVFDPQSESDLDSRFAFIRDCDELAIVLNEREIRLLGRDSDVSKAAANLLNGNKATVVVVKRGPFGCSIFDGQRSSYVPVFPTENVFKIGSGDVFTASFAKFWLHDKMDALTSATNASKCTSLYCETRSVDEIVRYGEFDRYPKERGKSPVIYLAGPFFSLSQRFLVEEARTALLALGVEVFSPMHDVGFEPSREVIAQEDLKGLEKCTSVLALIDGLDSGTLFEIGYARAKSLPVVTYGEKVLDDDLTMLEGTECLHVRDFCSAIYNSVWAGM